MSATWLDPGSGATFDAKFSKVTNPSPASSAGVTFFGQRSYICATDVFGTGEYVSVSFIAADAGRIKRSGRAVYRIHIVNYPNATVGLTYFALGDATNQEHFLLAITSAGVLRLYDGGSASLGNQIGSDGSTLSLATDYRISLAWDITDPTTFTIKWWLDGVLEQTVTAGTLGNGGTNTNLFRIGYTTNASVDFSNPHVIHVGHIYIDDGSGLDDVGDIRITPKRPAGNNVNAFDTAVGANPANRWENVNERPLSETNGWQQAGTSQVEESFTLEAAAVGDDDLSAKTILARSAWVWAKCGAGNQGTPAIIDNGSATAITLGTNSTLFTLVTTSNAYPSTIGLRSGGDTADAFLYECGTLIAYSQDVPPAPTVWQPNLIMVQSAAREPEPIMGLESRRFAAGVLLPGTPPPTVWEPFFLHRKTEIYLPDTSAITIARLENLRPLSPPILIRPEPVRVPVLVGYDPKASVRSREHEMLVAAIFNSLIMQGQLVRVPGQEARGIWKLGFIPDDQQDWNGAPPTTLIEALDRIAAALKALGQAP